ncbi:MAG: hypothetical protein ABSH41_08215 [Syntrophobacteraceae bacterium]
METPNPAFMAPARFLSVEFHTRFFPAFLWGRLRHKQRAGSGFNSFFELYLVLTICVVLVAIGVPAALSHRPIAGWVISGIGAAGILAMLINSILSRRGEPPSYDDFLVGFFFFFLVFGLSAGVFIGALEHYPLFQCLLIGAAGLLAGYAMGILAGLGLQYIGWLAAVLDPLAGLMVFGMLVVDLVLLSRGFFG